jgi:predicted nucleotidyltransferase
MFSLRAKLQNRILSYFFLNEEKHTYINELARLIESDPKNVYRTLVRLEGEGILTSEFKGKQRYFFCQRSNPLYRSYREVFLKTAGLEASLKDRLRKIAGLKEAFLFGSYAKKKFGPKSDIDVLLVGEHDPLEAEKILFRIQKESGREINAVHMKTGEPEERKKNGDQLVKSIFSGKVIKLL